jgi:isopenicillin-N N-acyltransferase-like protein
MGGAAGQVGRFTRAAGRLDGVGMLHVTVDASDPQARGEAYGAGVAHRLPLVWDAYRSLFQLYAGVDERTALRVGTEVLEVVDAWRPALRVEMEAVAAAGGIAVEAVGALNGRTELVVAAECATVGRVHGPAGPWLAQNWDWFLDAPERCVVVTTPTYTTFTEVGILAKIGVNRAGLALSLDILRHDSDRSDPIGIPIHLLLREVLGACATVDDVAELLAESPVSASSCLTVVTADGDGACFEVSPAGVARIGPADDGLLTHTNDFCDPVLALGERVGPKLASSCARRGDLDRLRPLTLDDARAALASHAAVPVPTCRHGDYAGPGLPLSGTAACLLMDPVAGTLDVGAGPPCQATFERFTVASPADV